MVLSTAAFIACLSTPYPPKFKIWKDIRKMLQAMKNSKYPWKKNESREGAVITREDADLTTPFCDSFKFERVSLREKKWVRRSTGSKILYRYTWIVTAATRTKGTRPPGCVVIVFINGRHEQRETCLCAIDVYLVKKKCHWMPALVSTCELLLSENTLIMWQRKTPYSHPSRFCRNKGGARKLYRSGRQSKKW